MRMIYQSQRNGIHKLQNYRYGTAFLAYAMLSLLLTFRYWGLGEVVAPHRQAQELGAPPVVSIDHPENRKFSDYTNAYIPEIEQLLHGRRSSWIGLWSSANELGRPLFHLSGFSPAYPPSAALGYLTSEPQRFITALSLGTCLLGGIFVMLLCRQLGLAQLAGLIAGGSMAASPFFMYWLTFPVFPAVATWSAAALYAMSRLSMRKDLTGWALLCFSVYSLLMTAYPQPVVVHAYMLTAYGLILAAQHRRESGSIAAAKYIGLLGSACLVASAISLPVYLDVYRTAADSTRVTADPSFYAEYLPQIASLTDLARFMTLALFPEVLGNPISSEFAVPYDGLSITPPVIFFGVCSLLLAVRKNWGWWLAIALICLFTLNAPAYVFGVKHLGFNISPSSPLGNAMLPITMIVAYGVDRLYGIVAIPRLRRRAITIVASICLIFGFAGSVIFALRSGLAIDWLRVCIILTVIVLLVAQIAYPSPLLACAALVVSIAYSGYPLMLHQDPSQIAVSSPLVNAVRSQLAPDSRYAVTGTGLKLLPPNLNATIGLDSIHSYNSLSSYRYRDLLKELGSDTRAFGRWNDSIQPDFESTAFWMSNVAVVLSPAPLPPTPALRYVNQFGQAYLYSVTSRMGCCLLVPVSLVDNGDGNISISGPALRAGQKLSKTRDQGDLIEFDVPDRAQSILVLSQKFHPDWHAEALTTHGWAAVPTTAINGIFQGVILTDAVSQVRLRFRPYARYSWIAYAFWTMVLLVLASQFANQNRNSARRVPAKTSDGLPQLRRDD